MPLPFVLTLLDCVYALALRRRSISGSVSLCWPLLVRASTLEHYSLAFVDQMIDMVTASTVIAYALYTFTADNLPSNHAMMLTIPFVIYGLFRYLFLIHNRNEGGSPEEVLLKDVPLMLTVVGWVVTSMAVLTAYR
jgi:hypothetical protein